MIVKFNRHKPEKYSSIIKMSFGNNYNDISEQYINKSVIKLIVRKKLFCSFKLKYIIFKNNSNKNTFVGRNFIINNFSQYKVIYNHKEYKYIEDLSEFSKNNEIEVKLVLLNSKMNIKSLFENCKSLKYVLDISNFDISNITNMSYMFCGCINLLSIPDISHWNTINVTDMSHMFERCIFLEKLPDISKWNISNVKTINHLFDRCLSLTCLPDISKWDTSKKRI